MNYFTITFYFSLFMATFLPAQNKDITLEDIWKYDSFKTENMDVLHSMSSGQEYTIFNFNKVLRSTSVDMYDYKTLEKVKTLVSSSELDDLEYFTNYKFSADEKKLILTGSEEPIYRRSSVGRYYVYNIQKKDLSLISEDNIQEPTFSPDGNMVAFVKDNNLFIKDLKSKVIKQITFDGERNKIINGITDWVYEEEFMFVRAFEWNADSNKIAFIKFDETYVPEFSMDIYGRGIYPTEKTFKYPKAGESNSRVSLHLYNLETNKLKELSVNKKYRDFYLPRIQWTNDPNVLSAQFLNRDQDELDLWFLDTHKNSSSLVLEEKDDAYVSVTDDLTFLDDNSFIWTSEKDGFNHIYHYDKDGDLINQITKGKWEVTDFYGYNKVDDMVYYQSVENSTINRDIYAIKLNGRNKKRLSKKSGTNDASFSADFSYYINTFSNISTPPEYTLNDSKTGEIIKKIKSNEALSEKLSDYKIPLKEFNTIFINGSALNIWTMKPTNFDENKKYPLFMTQYSGPGSQEVANQWHSKNDYWYQYLAQKGIIVACVDGRGTGFKGAKFKKITQNQLGKYEVEDQIEAAKVLGKLPYIDASRIGIWGWSYGGFMSSNCLFKGNDVFKMAIAVAPVTSWRFYDTIYTERYMSTPQRNPKGYDENSPINHVEKLKGKFLLIHGTSDDNVHVQNTMQLVEALIQADKQFDWAIYPDKNHGIYGGNTRHQLYKKMTNFIIETLTPSVSF